MLFTSVLEALTPAVGEGDKPVDVRLGGKTVSLKPIPAPVVLALRRVEVKPAVPMRYSGGSNSARVPVDRDDPKYAEYVGKLDVWYLNFRAAMIVCAKAHADGVLPGAFGDAEAKAAIDAGKSLAAELSLDAIDAAYAKLESAGDDLSASALSLAQNDLIAPLEPGDAKPSAELVLAREKGGDGVTLPYVLPPQYGWSPAYFVHVACTLYGCTPDQFASIDPATRVSMVAFARLAHAERRREHEELVSVGVLKTK